MVCQHMLAQMCHLLTFQMNHLSTLLAFAMKAYMLMTMLIMSQILEACTAGAVYHIFGNQSLLHHPVKLAVHRCGSDRNPLTFKVFAYIADCNMFSFHRAQIILQLYAIKLAVSMLDINDGNVKTTIAFYNFGSVGENEIDRIVSANSFSDMVIPQLDFVSDDRMVAYGDSEIAIFEGTQKPKLAQEIPLTGEAKSIFNNNKYVGVVYSNNDEKLTHHVAVYDMHGFTVMEKDFSQEYTEIGFLSNNEVCILNDHSCDIYTVRGIYKFHYDFDEELYKVISGGTGLNYTIILENSTEKVRLK